MICSEVIPLLDLLCDGTLPEKDSALVLDHVHSCYSCQPEWNEREQLRLRFIEAKQKVHMPADLMNRISRQIRNEEKANHKRQLKKVGAPLLAVAAAVALVGFATIAWHNQASNQPIAQLAQTAPGASVDLLVENFKDGKGGPETLADQSKLDETVGYQLRYLRLANWRLMKFGVYRLPAVALARFDFASKNGSKADSLTCYQSPSGKIAAPGVARTDINGKQVAFGTRGDLQFALWTQNDRDYFFITRMPQSALELIVRGT